MPRLRRRPDVDRARSLTPDWRKGDRYSIGRNIGTVVEVLVERYQRIAYVLLEDGWSEPVVMPLWALAYAERLPRAES